MLLNISVRGLHNNVIKLSYNGGLDIVADYVTHKLLISDTTLRSFLPPQVHKMTPKLRHIFGCEICIIPKNMHIDLNISRTRIVTYLQHKYVGRHTRNILFSSTSAAHYKDKLFPYGEYLHATMKDSAQCITCLPIKPNNMIIINFSLVFLLMY